MLNTENYYLLKFENQKALYLARGLTDCHYISHLTYVDVLGVIAYNTISFFLNQR